MDVIWLKPTSERRLWEECSFLASSVLTVLTYFCLQVHGKCMCKHNTAGTHCQHCAPLYNDRPWEAADGKTGSPKECRSKYQVHKIQSLLYKLICGLLVVSGNMKQWVTDTVTYTNRAHIAAHYDLNYGKELTACKFANVSVLPRMRCLFAWPLCGT